MMLVWVLIAFFVSFMCFMEAIRPYSLIGNYHTALLQNIRIANSWLIEGVDLSYSSDHKKQQHLFKTEDAVFCLDLMYSRKNQSTALAFLGDSLVRNQFLNFISLIPDYDRNIPSHLKEYESHFHEDRFVRSPLLHGLLISYKWRAVINHDLISDFKLWTSLQDHETPDFIFLGSTVHNMLQKYYKYNNSFTDVVEKELRPIVLNYLGVHPRKKIIWILQAPTTDLLGPIHEQNNFIIHTDKIRHYNYIIRQIFKGTRVVVWDSLLPAVGEYIRSCFITQFNRYDTDGYELCDDYIHPGHRVLALGSQLIFHYVCNQPNTFQ